MPVINIQGTPINFPDSAASPNWAPAVIQFAQLVANALSAVIGAYDVSPQVFILDPFNPTSSPTNVPSLSFPTTNVRAAFIKYSVFRTTSTTTSYQAGNIIVVYNPNNSVGNKWELIRDTVGKDSVSYPEDIYFTITDAGQVQFTTNALPGINHVGRLTYTAQALVQS